MSWFKKKKDPSADYDFDWPRVAAEKMRLFSADAEVLHPYINVDPVYLKAYEWAMKGFQMAAKDYAVALQQKGLMNR